MSNRDIHARNRRNALKSTGPRSAAGKARSAGNARRHGATSGAIDEETQSQVLAALNEIAPHADGRDALALALVQTQLTALSATESELAIAWENVASPGRSPEAAKIANLLHKAGLHDRYRAEAFSRRRRLLARALSPITEE